MKKSSNTIVFVLTAGAIALGGCAVSPAANQISDLAAKDVQEVATRTKSSVLQAEQLRVAQQEVDKPYLTGKSVALSREVSLPAALKANIAVTALFSADGVDLPTAAKQLGMAAKLSVAITPDALLPVSMFAPRLTSTGGQGSPLAPTGGPAVRGSGSIQLSHIGQNVPIYTALDEVARQAGVNWRVAGAGVEFYRTETRVYRLNALAHSATTVASLGRNPTPNNIFEASSKTGFVLEKQDQLQGVKNTVEAMLSAAGRVVLAPEAQTLVVTDTPAILKEVDAFVADTNKAMARRVRIVLETVEVISKDNSEVGLDWNLVRKSLSRAVEVTPPSGLAGTQSGSLSLSALTGKFLDSSLVVKALADVATVVNRKTFPFVTTSGRPVTQALRNTFSYVDSVQATGNTSSSISTPSPTVSQKEETVGTFVTFVPVAKDSGQIFLSVSYDVTSSDPLTPFSVGSASNGVTVQQKSINGTGIVQELPMRSGQTVVIGAIESINGSHSERRTAPGTSMFLGGSDKAGVQKVYTVLLVTCVTEDGF